MKTALVFVTICGLVAGRAAASNSESQPGSAQESVSRAGVHPLRQAVRPGTATHHAGSSSYRVPVGHGRASHANRSRSSGGANASLPTRVPHSQQRAAAGNIRDRQHGTARPGSAANPRSLLVKNVSNAKAVRPPSLFPSSLSSLDTVRHRGPNPAIVSGTGSSRASNTEGISGSRISRKP